MSYHLKPDVTGEVLQETNGDKSLGEERGEGEKERERLSSAVAPRRSSTDPTENLRAELTFWVVPSWGKRPGLSLSHGQSLGLDFPWKEMGPWVGEWYSPLQLRQSLAGINWGPSSYSTPNNWESKSLIRKNGSRHHLTAPTTLEFPLFSQVHSEVSFLQEAPHHHSLSQGWLLPGPLAPQPWGSLCFKGRLPVLKQPDGKFLEGSNTGWVIQTLCIGLSLYGAELFQVTSMDSGLKSRLEFCLAQFR